MGLVEEISEGMKAAMKAKQAIRVTTLRSIRASFLNEMKKDGAETLDDEVCIAVLRRLEKQRKESIEAFAQAGREDRAETEREELAVVQEFLPSLADEETTRGWVQTAIETSGASEPKEMGKVMGALMKAHRGEVDGGLAQKIARELLGDG
ncbi:MAG: GatB/YqeY domain-containing protein [Deltaproteobacteria bacterium]|nr:GatB/YqeY domain-containing protein [Deltaproteobacteria bacterium]MBW2394970.1 GatB/YqeY domain-containing protein [Deltaproteobacteria bacterium]